MNRMGPNLWTGSFVFPGDLHCCGYTSPRSSHAQLPTLFFSDLVSFLALWDSGGYGATAAVLWRWRRRKHILHTTTTTSSTTRQYLQCGRHERWWRLRRPRQPSPFLLSRKSDDSRWNQSYVGVAKQRPFPGFGSGLQYGQPVQQWRHPECGLHDDPHLQLTGHLPLLLWGPLWLQYEGHHYGAIGCGPWAVGSSPEPRVKS